MRWDLKYPPTIHTCKRCGEDFKVLECHLKAGMGDYCSRECSRPALYRDCLNCNKEYRIHPYEKESSKYCSRKCRAIKVGNDNSAENNYAWKGDKVGYSPLHRWIKARLGKIKECAYCGNEGRIEMASISHKAKRDINDYIPLCVWCHREYDRKVRISL